ncbi:predicted protein [Lichtheimia corymbifera JMRC:FSU:9682]|uniref:DUF1748-domain-containing protein n=2 Tax=Lichtheimia TaxID=688353 RepID=A0A068RFC9_9FUNG|nr:uncharacterized protein O0I10_008421 [Lichtheimia ornata]KAJ8655981.1 hypothetical protein O0I10_008421 [Lichtheimia ornata]CDH48337.1 predicted protein [Lichtheimia corymbifera JMRC:FSU:9682]
MLSRVLHYTADAILISTALAGIKRSTGLTPAVNKIEHEDVRSYAQKYLNMGEWIMDNSIVFMSNSSYFVRNNGNNNDH